MSGSGGAKGRFGFVTAAVLGTIAGGMIVAGSAVYSGADPEDETTGWSGFLLAGFGILVGVLALLVLLGAVVWRVTRR